MKKTKTAPLEKYVEKYGYNPVLIERIQPNGNLKVKDERYIQTGEGFTSCVQVYKFPDMEGLFWLDTLMNLDDALVTFDVSTEEHNTAIKKIKRSVEELRSQKNRAENEDDLIDAVSDYDLMHDLLYNVKKQGEDVKMCVCRIYVSGLSKEEVDEKVKNVILEIESHDYEATVFLNESAYQYLALFTPHSTQKKQPNKPVGLPMPSFALAGGYPFNFEQMQDKYGSYFGSTSTGGLVFFDPFHKTPLRTSYDGFIFGKKGSGKSTVIKMLETAMKIRGNYLRILDKVGEFTSIGKALNGVIVRMDGTQGNVNILHAFKVTENEVGNFAALLSKINTFYSLIKPSADDDELFEFEECVRRLYEEKGLWDGSTTQTITGLPNDAYPTLDELLLVVQQRLYVDISDKIQRTNISESTAEKLESIERLLRNLVTGYPHMFCQPTNIPDIATEKLVVFNVQGITRMKDGIYNAVMFNITNMMLDDMVRIGSVAKHLYDKENVPQQDLEKLILIIDEAHEFINTKNSLVLEFMLEIVNEARKFFTGLWFASPSLRSFMPDVSGEGSSAALEDLKKLFTLCQYKIIMNQDTSDVELLEKNFKATLTESQFTKLPLLGLGEGFFVTGEQTLHMYFEPTETELDLFEGGA